MKIPTNFVHSELYLAGNKFFDRFVNR